MKLKRAASILLAIAMIFVLAACGDKPDSKTEFVKVTFDTDGGSSISAMEIKSGGTVNKPEAPVKEGCVFEKWVSGETEFDFSTAITQDITLKAVYKKAEDPKPDPQPDPEPEKKPVPEGFEEGTFKIHFNSNGGSEVPDVLVKVGDEYVFPDNPYKVGSAFNCWRDKDGKEVGYLKERYTFDAKEYETVTLDAEWLEGYFTLRFHAKGGNTVHDVIAKENTYVTVTDKRIPRKSGCGFLGWYLISDNIPDTSNEKFANSFSYYGGWAFECSTDGKPIIFEARWETGGITLAEKNGPGSGYRTHVIMPGQSYLTDYEPSSDQPMGTPLGWYVDCLKSYVPERTVVNFPNAKAGDVILMEFKWQK